MRQYKVEQRGNSLVLFDTVHCRTIEDPACWFGMLGCVDARRRAQRLADDLNNGIVKLDNGFIPSAYWEAVKQ